MEMLLVLAVFLVAFTGLAAGVLLKGQRGALKGSCGGAGADMASCQTCHNKDACERVVDGAGIAAEFAALPHRPRDRTSLGRPRHASNARGVNFNRT